VATKRFGGRKAQAASTRPNAALVRAAKDYAQHTAKLNGRGSADERRRAAEAAEIDHVVAQVEKIRQLFPDMPDERIFDIVESLLKRATPSSNR
jgi:hypothetical protein